jgi:hypothetical protein
MSCRTAAAATEVIHPVEKNVIGDQAYLGLASASPPNRWRKCMQFKMGETGVFLRGFLFRVQDNGRRLSHWSFISQDKSSTNLFGYQAC